MPSESDCTSSKFPPISDDHLISLVKPCNTFLLMAKEKRYPWESMLNTQKRLVILKAGVASWLWTSRHSIQQILAYRMRYIRMVVIQQHEHIALYRPRSDKNTTLLFRRSWGFLGAPKALYGTPPWVNLSWYKMKLGRLLLQLDAPRMKNILSKRAI